MEKHMNTYTWNAKDYDKNSQAQQKWARELIASLDLKGTEDILDLGCGDGKVTAEIADLVNNGSIIGVDNSKQMIELAQEKYPSNLHPNLSFQVMDASELSFENCFDLAFSNAVLHWVKNHQPVIQGLYKSLKTGGKILLRMGGKGDAEGIISVMDEVRTSNKWAQYFADFELPFTFMAVDDYHTLLNDAGFSIIRVQLIPKDMMHDGKSRLKGWIRTTWLPYTGRIPDEMKDEFIEEAATTYLAKFPLDADGKVHVAMVMIEIEADRLS
jgi:trans-aconitate 2-methyltransferase